MLPGGHKGTRTGGDQGRDKWSQASQLVPRQEACNPRGLSHTRGNFRRTSRPSGATSHREGDRAREAAASRRGGL